MGCGDDFPIESFKWTPCGHGLCAEEYYKCLERKFPCPMCRRSLSNPGMQNIMNNNFMEMNNDIQNNDDIRINTNPNQYVINNRLWKCMCHCIVLGAVVGGGSGAGGAACCCAANKTVALWCPIGTMIGTIGSSIIGSCVNKFCGGYLQGDLGRVFE